MATRTPATKRPAAGRFGRSAEPSTQRSSRRRTSPATSRRRSIVPRRTPAKSGMAKLTDGVAGALPGRANKGSGGGGGTGRTTGLAVLAGAAGLAFKNRSKLQGMLRRKRSDAGGTGDDSNAGPPPSPSEG
jgi:hypothetical protein